MFRKIAYQIHKILRWEYWPQALVYAPVFPVYLYYAAKKRTPYFIIAANPDIENGGYLMESKFSIHQKIPAKYVPETLLIKNNTLTEDLLQALAKTAITYPFVCKPDIGGKGIGVEIIEDAAGLTEYNKNADFDFLIQEKVAYKNEIGVFYCRYPNEEKGFLTGIVGKTDMQVIGDGVKTVQALIQSNPRFYYQRKYLYKKFSGQLKKILPKGERLVLSSIGNHARGSQFIDLSYKISAPLTLLFDKIAKEYNTFYFGRLDVIYKDWKSLEEGKNFKIIELNGSGSEPTHIYDPKNSIVKAWKIIVQHWKIVAEIAKQQHSRNVDYTSLAEGKQLQKNYRLHERKVKNFSANI